MTAYAGVMLCRARNLPFGEFLRVRRRRGGQGELKRCAPPGVAGNPQPAAVRLNDRATDGQPHSSPFIFGRKECLEDLVRLLLGQAHTRIAH